MNAAERLGLIHDALLAHNAEINHLPLHRQVIPWATREQRHGRAPRRQLGHPDVGDGEVTAAPGSGRLIQRVTAAASTA